MQRPVFKAPGTPVEELDTPALVVDLDRLDSNIETLHSFFRDRESTVRPHVGCHRCPAIARRQLAVVGTAGGIAVNTVGEAESFAHHGFNDISIASQVASPPKIARVCALARDRTITVACDSPVVAGLLSDAAVAAGVVLRVVVDVHTRLERGGVEPGRHAVDLALAIENAPGLRFVGLMTYEGAIFVEDAEELETESERCIQLVLDTREAVEREGIEVEVVSVGGTYNYEIAGAMSGVTEVQAGSYALMDYRYAQYRPQFQQAARVMCTVTSHVEPGKALTDAGEKSIGSDGGPPVVDGLPGVTGTGGSAEHGHLALEGAAQSTLSPGDKVWFIPQDLGTCFNIYDYVYATRAGRLEAVWPIAARGLYR